MLVRRSDNDLTLDHAAECRRIDGTAAYNIAPISTYDGIYNFYSKQKNNTLQIYSLIKESMLKSSAFFQGRSDGVWGIYMYIPPKSVQVNLL